MRRSRDETWVDEDGLHSRRVPLWADVWGWGIVGVVILAAVVYLLVR